MKLFAGGQQETEVQPPTSEQLEAGNTPLETETEQLDAGQASLEMESEQPDAGEKEEAAAKCIQQGWKRRKQPTEAMAPVRAHRLGVSILQAHGLKHMNNFTGDNPYVICEVNHLDTAAEKTQVETKPVAEGDTLNPFWGETHTLEPWCEGESLEFTVYDKGLVGSKTEGKAVLPPELFFPQGFSGMVAISGLPDALLHIIVRPLGPVESGEPVDASSKKKKKKMKVSKKQKRCC